jgi:Piwi domain
MAVKGTDDGYRCVCESAAKRRLSSLPIGADVSHAPPDSDRPSIAGMVSSVDEHFCQYVASTRVQEPHTELIEDLDGMIEVTSCQDSSFVLARL